MLRVCDRFQYLNPTVSVENENDDMESADAQTVVLSRRRRASGSLTLQSPIQMHYSSPPYAFTTEALDGQLFVFLSVYVLISLFNRDAVIENDFSLCECGNIFLGHFNRLFRGRRFAHQ